MISHYRWISHICFVIGAAFLFPAALCSAATQDVVFTIDPTQSLLKYSLSTTANGALVPVSPGTDESAVFGHFLVRFDPLNDTPSTIQFIGNDGFFQQTSDLDVASTSPGLEINYSNLNWDFSSPAINGGGGNFPATTTSFKLLTGTLTESFPNSPSATYDESGYTGTVTVGLWKLSESAPGSGDWSLDVSGYHIPPNQPAGNTEKFTLDAHSTAHFGGSNVTTLAPTDTSGGVLGGAAVPGGVSITLPGPSNGGTFSAQQIPDNTGLSQAAVAAAEANPIFLASLADMSVNPQIWDVQYTGLLAGQSATLVFHYDPALLPEGTNQSALGIWHFNKLSNVWEFGGTVNTTDHTITFTTTSFSPFELGVQVPEPATIVLAGVGLIALLVEHRRRRAR
jgi:hypothetical protein